MKNLIKFLFCFNSLSANTIEKIIIILSAISILLTIIGLAVIPWKYTSSIMKIFYILSIIFLLLSIFKSIFFLYNRKHQKFQDNSKMLYISIILCFIELSECIFSIFTYLFILAGAIPDFKDKNSNSNTEVIDEEEELIKENIDIKSVSNGELGYAIFSIIFNLIIWVILLFLCISDLVRIKFGINGSYNDYIRDKNENESEKSKRKINDKEEKPNLEYPYYLSTNKAIENNKEINETNVRIYNKPKSDFNYKFEYHMDSFTRNETDANNVMRYSYKEKYKNKNNKNCNSVDIIQKPKITQNEKEKYLEKYLEGYGADPYYSNFENRSALNISSVNNSMNPGY